MFYKMTVQRMQISRKWPRSFYFTIYLLTCSMDILSKQDWTEKSIYKAH